MSVVATNNCGHDSETVELEQNPSATPDDSLQVIRKSTNIFTVVLDRLKDKNLNQVDLGSVFAPVSSVEDCPAVYGVESQLGFDAITLFWDLLWIDDDLDQYYRRPIE